MDQVPAGPELQAAANLEAQANPAEQAPAPYGLQESPADDLEAQAWLWLAQLSADSLEGRACGSPGAEKARRIIEKAFAQSGVRPWGRQGAGPDSHYRDSFYLPIAPRPRDGSAPDTLIGVNLVGFLKGSSARAHTLIFCAHYDHLGWNADSSALYNGADDNASGVAVLLALARYFSENTPRHSLLFLALDAEEIGLLGAEHWVRSSGYPLEQVRAVINMDMVARADNGQLWASGTRFHKALREPLAEAAKNPVQAAHAAAHSPALRLRLGRDARFSPLGRSWLKVSDHYPFYRAGLPFVYLGVEDHRDYHRTSDKLERIDRATFLASLHLIRRCAEALDTFLEQNPQPRGRVRG